MTTAATQPTPAKHPQYERWLKNAYEYYIGLGGTNMSDYEWDLIAREIGKNPEIYDELRGKDYNGQSLFWMKAADYPEWAKTI